MTVNVVSLMELKSLTAHYQGGGLRRYQQDGLAVLYRDRSAGTWRCEVYVMSSASEATLAHERRHCLGWVH